MMYGHGCWFITMVPTMTEQVCQQPCSSWPAQPCSSLSTTMLKMASSTMFTCVVTSVITRKLRKLVVLHWQRLGKISCEIFLERFLKWHHNVRLEVNYVVFFVVLHVWATCAVRVRWGQRVDIENLETFLAHQRCGISVKHGDTLKGKDDWRSDNNNNTHLFNHDIRIEQS